MKQVPPIFGRTFDATRISQMLNLNENEIDDTMPIQEVSTGLPAIIVPLRTLDAIRRINLSREKYFKLIENTQAKAILVFTSQTYHEENDLNVRFSPIITAYQRILLLEVETGV